MKKLTAIQTSQANLLMGYLREFKNWPQSLSDMVDQWEPGFFNRKTRKKDLLLVLNHLGEIGKIEFMTVEKPNGSKEIGFRIVPGA